MIWHFLDSGFNTGEFNMKYDLELAQNCSPQDAYFRLFRWQPNCISLGANQSFDDIDLAKTEADGIDVVKRPTGGRAILHAEEWTYSVVLPLNFQYSPKEVYSIISNALIRGLDLYNPLLAKSELESVQPNFPKLLEESTGVLCFASTAKNEVKFGGKKLIGSAQRKLNNTILQHGSILCGTFHQKLADYLNTSDESKEMLRNELSTRTTEIETILNAKVDYELLKECLIKGFEQEWQIELTRS
ncbi:MAG: lipoate--protein ligase family protein [Ignavibacteriales bacterium]|nr:lipoate--protein ligase family protein [Ignavibacteriales bacterium]